ncbi:protein GRAVITROPIC IN THE LIGHT 1 [Coffea eugenioides]|uniref:protein GRAVITROPIC IN THE LIGHT 1 n=1 Tax=Coffea eugenioides TaxID=49369 RepID=UPI000F6060D8|nr:protein GRAVITROPIC IN THE LIGHT 1 [Coffea eugenioides]
MMECAAAKPSNTPSNISDIVSRFARVCKFMSIGVFTAENQCSDGGKKVAFLGEETSSDLSAEAERDNEKIHLVDEGSVGCECGHLEICKLFDTVSTVKLAYIKLQEAHIPYDPDKIVAADEVVVSQLETLCAIKRAFKEKQLREVNSVSACLALLLAEIQVQERLLEKLKSEVKTKEAKVVNLHRELEDLKLENKRLSEEFKKRGMECIKTVNVSSFEEIVKAVSKATHDFAKPLIALMKVSGWDLDHAANAIENKVVYAKRSHKKYAFEAYIARRMFHGFSSQSCDTERIMTLDDPINVLIEEPQSEFAKFCRKKYLLLIHPWMETSFFGNTDHRTFVTNGLHPYTPFYRAFVRMARWVWILQGTYSATIPKVEIFYVDRGSDFSGSYMECVEELKDDAFMVSRGDKRFKVEFMILPGFRIGDTLIRSQVYLSKVRSSNVA